MRGAIEALETLFGVEKADSGLAGKLVLRSLVSREPGLEDDYLSSDWSHPRAAPGLTGEGLELVYQAWNKTGADRIQAMAEWGLRYPESAHLGLAELEANPLVELARSRQGPELAGTLTLLRESGREPVQMVARAAARLLEDRQATPALQQGFLTSLSALGEFEPPGFGRAQAWIQSHPFRLDPLAPRLALRCLVGGSEAPPHAGRFHLSREVAEVSFEAYPAEPPLEGLYRAASLPSNCRAIAEVARWSLAHPELDSKRTLEFLASAVVAPRSRARRESLGRQAGHGG